MVSIKTYMDFWGEDLMSIKIPKEIKRELPSSTVIFLTKIGLPKSERVYNERKTYIENTTPLPEIILHERNIERSVKSSGPYFEFTSFLHESFSFQGQKFIKLESMTPNYEGEYEIAIDVITGNVNAVIRNPIVPWPVALPFPPQNLFINSGVSELGLFLTVEILSLRKRTLPTRQYYEAYKSRNNKLIKKTKAELDQIIDDLENELRVLDNKAFTFPDSYWQNYFLNLREL